MKRYFNLLLLLLFLFSCHTEQATEVTIDVTLHIRDDNHTTPLTVVIENNSKNAGNFLWTFEGGEPATSTKKAPGPVLFTEPGEHKVTLEAWNDGHRDIETYTVRVDNAVTASFTATAETNNYAPAQFTIENKSTGGTSYHWTFEGGEPSSFEGQNPPDITYANEGTYTIRLTAGNGSATFTSEQVVEIREALSAGFTIVPSPEDEDDMEAPVRAAFDTELAGVESLKWECNGAAITNPASKDAQILFPAAGSYTVKLTVSNDKQTKTVEKSITVKGNTNLRTHSNIKLGINTAQSNTGVFYSTKLRRIVGVTELDDYGSDVDIAFFGLNDRFSYNRFVSPDALDETPLTEIPNAGTTKFINRTELGGVRLSAVEFNSMTTDALLRNLDIKEAAYGDEAFDNTVLPRVVLFETGDGRKGAVLVREMVSDGRSSYIVVDIKVQKND